MKLIYIGEGRWYPGWPAEDHEEPDAKLAAAKLASGLYKQEKEVKNANSK